MVTKKDELKNKIIKKLKEQKTYFSYEEIKSLIEKEKIEITPSSLKSYVHELTKTGVIFDAGKGWYSIIKEPFELNTKPLQPIIKKIKKEFPLLKFSCWSTEQLNPFTHHLLAKFVTFVYTDSDFIPNTAEFLENTGYSVYQNPDKAEIEKRFKIDKITVVFLPSISKQPENPDHCAPIEKLLIDFLMENRKFRIMDQPEAEEVVNTAVFSARINISGLFSYAKRRKFNIPKTINQLQQSAKGGGG